MIFNSSFNYLYLSGGGGACGHQIDLTRRVLGRKKQTRRGRWRSWGLSVVSAGGGEAGGEDGVAELQLWSRHQARGAARHHCRVNQNNAAAANAK